MRKTKSGNYVKKCFTFFTLTALALLPSEFLSGQSLDSLKSLKGYKTKIFFSPGNDQRAVTVAQRLDKVYNYFNERISFEPKVPLLILNPQDWGKFTSFPVYGMPHYDEKRDVLIIASDNNEFWNSFIPDMNTIGQDMAGKISKTYVDGNGTLTMQPFFDLLAIHELGHAYHFQAGLNMQRKWLGELFCNIMLHTYIADNEPDQIPALTLFPLMVINNGTEGFKYTSLNDLENHYEEIGQKHARNYGWYQCRWHASAGNIYDSAGVEGFGRLWNSLTNQEVTLNDTDLVSFLSNIDQSLADVYQKWDDLAQQE